MNSRSIVATEELTGLSTKLDYLNEININQNAPNVFNEQVDINDSQYFENKLQSLIHENSDFVLFNLNQNQVLVLKNYFPFISEFDLMGKTKILLFIKTVGNTIIITNEQFKLIVQDNYNHLNRLYFNSFLEKKLMINCVSQREGEEHNNELLLNLDDYHFSIKSNMQIINILITFIQKVNQAVEHYQKISQVFLNYQENCQKVDLSYKECQNHAKFFLLENQYELFNDIEQIVNDIMVVYNSIEKN